MDPVARLEETAPLEVEVKRLAGRIVWLRDDDDEWIGPAEVALALLADADPHGGFWDAFGIDVAARLQRVH